MKRLVIASKYDWGQCLHLNMYVDVEYSTFSISLGATFLTVLSLTCSTLGFLSFNESMQISLVLYKIAIVWGISGQTMGEEQIQCT